MHARSGPAAELVGIDAPSSRILPMSAFSSLAFQAMEDAAIWSRLWTCIGFAADIPHQGDVLPFTVGDHGIHVERMADGSLSGRFNKAQHGGCRVVPLQCRTGSKTRCSFTACGYSRDRRPILAADPDAASQLDQYLGLRPERLLTVAVETWGPLLLARLDPSSRANRDWPSLSSVFGRQQAPSSGNTLWRELPGNWKTVVMHLAARAAPGSKVTTLFPNVIVQQKRDFALVAVLQPVALDRTLCRFRVFGDNDEALPSETFTAALGALTRNAEPPALGDLELSNRDPVFETALATALSALDAEATGMPFFRTHDKERW